jgi:hypothetical protein
MTAASALSDVSQVLDPGLEPGTDMLSSSGRPRTALDALRADRIAYMADMISELQCLAHEAQCMTLAGILGLAHAEAQQQIQKLTV